MGSLDALWHLSALFGQALMTGALAALLAKLAWRHKLKAVAWRRLAGYPALAAALVSLAGLVLTGRDGRMTTYAAMVLAAALALWWVGFGPRRRSA